ncbi:MAG: hypothetical protein U1F76_01165 [Candidatus Competibacteraceae bacterium]
MVTWLTACGLPQVHSTSRQSALSLAPGDLEKYGIAFITPATVTGQEEEKQTIALDFTDVLKETRPQVRCVTLPETLSAINRAGLADEYRNMFNDYQQAGIFNKEILRKIGEVTHARYIAQLKLSGFSQRSNDRFSIFGLRVLQTHHAGIRLFLQIWDSQNGTIVWEGVEELDRAEDTFTEANVTLRTVLEEASQKMVARLPEPALGGSPAPPLASGGNPG